MVHYRRNFVAGGTYFFTVTLADRRAETLTNYVQELRRAFRACRAERPFSIEAIVVLPDHLHTIMTLPPNDADFSSRWRQIKSLFSRAIARRDFSIKRNARGEYTIWQRRFWEHTIRNDLDYERHVDYIHYNPIKHGFVSRVAEWPHSSFHRYVKLGILPKDWAGDAAKDSSRNFGEPKD